MQWLAEISVRRPVFTWVMVLTLVVIGGASIFGLGVDRFPNIDFPIVVVTTRYEGASPEQVETEVSDVVEEAVNSISGLDELQSNSYEGLSVVIARFDLDKDVAVAAQEVRDRINRSLAVLPREIDQPRIEQLDPNAAPIMEVALTTNRSSREATDYANRVIRRRLESLPGVGGVSITGGREREIQVIVDPQALAAVGLTARDVQRTLATENVELPGGNVEQGSTTTQVRVQGRVTDPEQFAQLPVARRQDRVVRVGDLAKVLDTDEEPTSAATLDGKGVVMIGIRKQSGTNTVAVVDGLREQVAEIQKELPPAYQIEIVRDESEFVRNSISAVEEHLILGGFLAAFVVFLFLGNVRATIIAALAIPSSIIATFAFINALDLTLNIMTLLALTLSVGIVIDDAIVVLENITRFIEEKGMDPRRAAVLATREIGLAVLATSLSLVAVFLPVAFMGGIVGRFMASFGYTMSFAILVSLFVSFTLTPMLTSRWIKGSLKPGVPRPQSTEAEGAGEPADDLEFPDPAPGDRQLERGEFLAWLRGERTVQTQGGNHGGGHGEGGGLYGRIEAGYLRLLGHAMRHRWVVGILLVVALVAIVPIGAAVPKAFLPPEDESRFEVTIRAPEGTSLAQTQLIAERVARGVRGLPGVIHTIVTVGSPPGDPSGRGANQASVYVALVPATERDASQDDLIARVRADILPKFASLNLRTLVSPIAAIGGSGQSAAPVQYVLRGPDIKKLEEYGNKLLVEARKIPGVADADLSLVTGSPAYEVHIDRSRSADLGVSVADISAALRLLIGGVDVTSFNENGERYDVRMRAPLDARSDPGAVAQVTVPTSNGGSVRLSDVATIERATGPASIQHIARQRQVTVYINLVPNASETNIVAGLDRIKESLHMEPGYKASLSGRSRELARTMQGFLFAIALSFAFMYLVLAAQFESWLHPVTILASLPLTLPFALFSILIFGQSLNIYSMLGVLVLFGVVKKNSILQIDHMRDLRRRGVPRADAIMLGNRNRLRPILMTTLAFVAGMVPMLASSGAGSGTNRAMGAVIAGGQSLSLLLTLIATPVLYSWFDDLSHSERLRGWAAMFALPFRSVERWWAARQSAAAAE
jgi:HAE1 family hydrophobic/amphiphilic exporter-1